MFTISGGRVLLLAYVPLLNTFLSWGSLWFVIGESIENETFLFHSAIEIDSAFIGIVVEVYIEALVIQCFLERYGRLYLTLKHLLKIHIREEWMTLDLCRIFQESQSLFWFYLK